MSGVKDPGTGGGKGWRWLSLTARQRALAKVVFILALCAGAALQLRAVSSFAD